VTALNRQGKQTRGGEPPAEWTAVTVKRVLLQPINNGTLVYNRSQARGRTHVPRPEEEHIVVAGFCEPIFTHEETAELREIAAEIEGEPPRTKSSEYLLSGLLHCVCGAKMYAVQMSRRADGQRELAHLSRWVFLPRLPGESSLSDDRSLLMPFRRYMLGLAECERPVHHPC